MELDQIRNRSKLNRIRLDRDSTEFHRIRSKLMEFRSDQIEFDRIRSKLDRIRLKLDRNSTEFNRIRWKLDQIRIGSKFDGIRSN
jgi:hypothetical protein